MYRMYFDDGTAKYFEYDPFDNGSTAKPFFYDQLIFDPFTNDENSIKHIIFNF